MPSLTSQILPEIDFNILSNGITIKSNERLSTPRFILYDTASRCKQCKSTEVELDFIVTKDGLTIYCSRIKGPRFVAFDNVMELPGHCYFRIKNKGRVFNIPHGETTIPPKQHVSSKQQMPTAEEFQQFYSSLTASTAGIPGQQQQPTMEKELDQFFGSLNAATAGIPATTTVSIKSAKKKAATEKAGAKLAKIEKANVEELKGTGKEQEEEISIIDESLEKPKENTKPKPLV